MTNLMPQIGSLLDNTDMEVLVYSGDKDWICNWRGGEAWTHATKWKSQTDFQSQDYSDWQVDGKSAGKLKQFGNLHFLKVADAGHMVPMNQPVAALSMLKTFVANGFNKTNNVEFTPLQ